MPRKQSTTPFNIPTMFPQQVENVEAMINILDTGHVCLNKSPTGSGKTYVSCQLALQSEFSHIVVLCPSPTIASQWESVMKKFHISNEHVYTYSKFVGKVSSGINHIFLDREDNEGEVDDDYITSSGTVPVYTTTDICNDMMSEGMLLIADEAFHLTNKSLRYLVVQTMIDAMYGTPSKCLLLSAIPFDTVDKAERILSLMGLYHDDNDELTMRLRTNGIEESIIDDLMGMTYEEYMNVMIPIAKDQFSVTMTLSDINIIQDIGNEYFDVDEEDSDTMTVASKSLSKLLQLYSPDYKRSIIASDGINMYNGLLYEAKTGVMMSLEQVKMMKIVDEITESLNNKHKVIVFMSYIDNIESLSDAFKEDGYNTAVFIGTKMTSIQKVQTIRTFMRDNDKIQLLVVSINAGSEGISMHDLTGNWPRDVYIIPDKMSNLIQAAGRVVRVGTLTDVKIRIIYLRHKVDAWLRRSMMTKMNVLESIVGEGGPEKKQLYDTLKLTNSIDITDEPDV